MRSPWKGQLEGDIEARQAGPPLLALWYLGESWDEDEKEAQPLARLGKEGRDKRQR